MVGHQLAGMKVSYFEQPADVKRLSVTDGIDGILFPYVADARSEQDRLIKHCHEVGLRLI